MVSQREAVGVFAMLAFLEDFLAAERYDRDEVEREEASRSVASLIVASTAVRAPAADYALVASVEITGAVYDHRGGRGYWGAWRIADEVRVKTLGLAIV